MKIEPRKTDESVKQTDESVKQRKPNIVIIQVDGEKIKIITVEPPKKRIKDPRRAIPL